MPLYEYECGKCSHRFEMKRSFSEGASANCTQWNSTAMRIFVPVPIVFKGSGFYVTDYRKENYNSESKKESPAESKNGGCNSTNPGNCQSPKCNNPACKN
jgi:putative FmdB family regulatory protein